MRDSVARRPGRRRPSLPSLALPGVPSPDAASSPSRRRAGARAPHAAPNRSSSRAAPSASHRSSPRRTPRRSSLRPRGAERGRMDLSRRGSVRVARRVRRGDRPQGHRGRRRLLRPRRSPPGEARGYASYMRIDVPEPCRRGRQRALHAGAAGRDGRDRGDVPDGAPRFEDLGYRRYEWKCNALNAPSRRAAVRLGFTYRRASSAST